MQARAPSSRTSGPTGRRPVEHVRYWLGNGLSAGRRRLDSWISGLGDRLVAVDVDGTTAYVVREDVDALAASRPPQAVRFLPGHDRWVMGPGTKDVHVTPRSRRDPITRKANPVSTVVSSAERGHARAPSSSSPGSTTDGHPRRPIEQEAARLAGILGGDLRMDSVPSQPVSARAPPPARPPPRRGRAPTRRASRGRTAPPASRSPTGPHLAAAAPCAASSRPGADDDSTVSSSSADATRGMATCHPPTTWSADRDRRSCGTSSRANHATSPLAASSRVSQRRRRRALTTSQVPTAAATPGSRARARRSATPSPAAARASAASAAGDGDDETDGADDVAWGAGAAVTVEIRAVGCCDFRGGCRVVGAAGAGSVVSRDGAGGREGLGDAGGVGERDGPGADSVRCGTSGSAWGSAASASATTVRSRRGGLRPTARCRRRTRRASTGQGRRGPRSQSRGAPGPPSPGHPPTRGCVELEAQGLSWSHVTSCGSAASPRRP